MRSEALEAERDAPLLESLDRRAWARVSRSGIYRYVLGRRWDSSLPNMVVMGVNPSTADHVDPDPTLTRCVGFARDSGHGAVIIVNPFAFRSRDVRVLACVAEPVGPFNDYWIDVVRREGHAPGALPTFVWASGPPSKVPPVLRPRFGTVEARLRAAGVVLHALAFTKDGSPSHPLMLPASCRPVRWERA